MSTPPKALTSSHEVPPFKCSCTHLPLLPGAAVMTVQLSQYWRQMGVVCEQAGRVSPGLALWLSS